MEKRKKDDDHMDEIELDLDRLSEYIGHLKPGEYVDMDELVEKCAFKELDIEKLKKHISAIKPGEYIFFDDLIIRCSKETDKDGEDK